MDLQIKEILAKHTYKLRHTLLRKGQPYESCKLESDNHIDSIHLGAFVSNQLVGILSALPNKCPNYNSRKAMHLRAMAVHPDFQRKKIATHLIRDILKQLKDRKSIEIVWLNARVKANDLYLGCGFTPLDSPFEINPIGIHQRFIKSVTDES